VKNVEEVVKIGDEFKVKVVGIDELGRINLSRKQVEENNSK
jgi:predicted RNA-binding protein with RPS1 domain